MLLLSQDYGKHLLGVEDLLQKHSLVETDISVQADRVRSVNNNAHKFAEDSEGEPPAPAPRPRPPPPAPRSPTASRSNGLTGH